MANPVPDRGAVNGTDDGHGAVLYGEEGRPDLEHPLVGVLGREGAELIEVVAGTEVPAHHPEDDDLRPVQKRAFRPEGRGDLPVHLLGDRIHRRPGHRHQGDAVVQSPLEVVVGVHGSSSRRFDMFGTHRIRGTTVGPSPRARTGRLHRTWAAGTCPTTARSHPRRDRDGLK